MSGVSFSITSGDQAQTASPASIPCLVGCCTAVSSGVYQFDAGADVSSTLGGGPLADAAYAILRQPGVSRVVVAPAAQTWSTAPSVSHSGTGPSVSLALANGASGCYDDHHLRLRVSQAGALGVGRVAIAYDGVTEIEEIPIPVEQPAVNRGTVDLTGSVPAMNTLTLVFTAPTSTTITFATSPTTPQGLADAFNALAVAAPLAVRARIAETSSGIFFELYSTAVGASATMTVDATSTGETTLGLSTTAKTGAAATLSLPWTGLVATFASGSYVKDETYSSTCTGPRPTLAAELTAMTAAHDSYGTKPFGFFAFVHPSTSAANAAQRQSSISTQLATWQADTSNPLAWHAGIAAQFHTASSTLATNDTNIASADSDLLTAFASSSAAVDSVVPGDVYLSGATALRAGTYRRSAALAWAMRRAGVAKLADDVGSDSLAEGSLLSPDGLTRARDEARASTKLGSGSGPGFSVLTSTAGGLGAPRFTPGATRAGAASRLRYSGVVAVAKELVRLVSPIALGWLAKVYPTDPQTGMLLDGEKTSRANEVRSAIALTLATEGGSPLNASSFDVQILDPATGRYIDNGQIRVKVIFVPLGETESVSVEISATGVIVAGG